MQKCEHPSATMDLSKMWHPGSGRQLRSDAKGTTAGAGRTRLGATAIRIARLLVRRQLEDTWRRHQSMKGMSRGKCNFRGCPNLRRTKAKRKRPYDTNSRCEECTAAKDGKPVYLCNEAKKTGGLVNCHFRHHRHFHSKKPKR